MKILFYVERGLYECIKIYFNINFLYNHPKASKQPLIAVPIIMNNPVVGKTHKLLTKITYSENLKVKKQFQ